MNNVFLLQITEFNHCFDEPHSRIEAVYSSNPTKKQLLDGIKWCIVVGVM